MILVIVDHSLAGNEKFQNFSFQQPLKLLKFHEKFHLKTFETFQPYISEKNALVLF